MIKPTFLNVCICILISYIIFLVTSMVTNEDYRLLEFSNIRSSQDLFYYLWIVLFFPIVDIILFSVPLFYSFKIKKIFVFILTIIAVYMFEYLIIIYFTSQKIYNEDGLQKVIIGVILFFIFFYKNKFKLYKRR
jgi:hypothetical protein